MEIQETPDSSDGQPVAIKGITTTLDYVDFGTEDDIELELKKTRRERRRLPENIESRPYTGISCALPGLLWPNCSLPHWSTWFDMIMVGQPGQRRNFIRQPATQPKFLIMTMVMALNTGATAVIARARGSGQHERTNDILRAVTTDRHHHRHCLLCCGYSRFTLDGYVYGQ